MRKYGNCKLRVYNVAAVCCADKPRFGGRGSKKNVENRLKYLQTKRNNCKIMINDSKVKINECKIKVNDFKIKMNGCKIKSYNLKMDKTIEVFSKELSSLRTGRANSAMLDLVRVNVYGQQMPISQVASITTPEPRMINIQVWDQNNVDLVDAAIKKFHIDPNKAILIELDDEGWKFTCEYYDINIDNGLYFGNKNLYSENQNIFTILDQKPIYDF